MALSSSSSSVALTLLPLLAGLHELKGIVVVDQEQQQEFPLARKMSVLVRRGDAPGRAGMEAAGNVQGAPSSLLSSTTGDDAVGGDQLFEIGAGAEEVSFN